MLVLSISSLLCVACLLCSVEARVQPQVSEPDFVGEEGGRVRSSQNISRPLIGIYTQDSPPDYDGIPGKNDEYIAASYVKLVESAGARPVAISYTLGEEDLKEMLDSVDGFVFPGGGMDLSLNKTFATNAKVILDYAQARPDFPIVGICLGFELLSVVSSNDDGILSSFDASNLLDKPVWQYQNYMNSKLSQFYPPVSELSRLLVFENHHSGLSVGNFKNELSGFFNLLATSYDREQKEYVSAIEAKDYPVFGFQFHPEKNTYEWKPTLQIPHDDADLEVTRGVSKLLAFYSRQSFGHRGTGKDNTPELQTEVDTNKLLIYNIPAIFSAPYSDQCSFEQVYFFPRAYDPRSQP